MSVVREHLQSPQDVYNFEVEGFHTYFVASAGVWVHNACGGSGKPLIIGENMKRVNRYASRTGGHAYRPIKDGASKADALRRNERMIKDAMRRGREIVDIGPDFRRRASQGASDFYQMERRVTKGYDRYRKVFKRRGRSGR